MKYGFFRKTVLRPYREACFGSFKHGLRLFWDSCVFVVLSDGSLTLISHRLTATAEYGVTEEIRWDDRRYKRDQKRLHSVSNLHLKAWAAAAAIQAFGKRPRKIPPCVEVQINRHYAPLTHDGRRDPNLGTSHIQQGRRRPRPFFKSTEPICFACLSST